MHAKHENYYTVHRNECWTVFTHFRLFAGTMQYDDQIPHWPASRCMHGDVEMVSRTSWFNCLAARIALGALDINGSRTKVARITARGNDCVACGRCAVITLTTQAIARHTKLLDAGGYFVR